METRLCARAAVCDPLQSAMCPSFSNEFVHLAARSPAGFTYDGKVLQEQHSKFSKEKKKKKVPEHFQADTPQHCRGELSKSVCVPRKQGWCTDTNETQQ